MYVVAKEISRDSAWSWPGDVLVLSICDTPDGKPLANGHQFLGENHPGFLFESWSILDVFPSNMRTTENRRACSGNGLCTEKILIRHVPVCASYFAVSILIQGLL